LEAKEKLDGIRHLFPTDLYGVEKKEIRIQLDVDRIIAHHIDINRLIEKLRRSHIMVTAGKITDANPLHSFQHGRSGIRMVRLKCSWSFKKATNNPYDCRYHCPEPGTALYRHYTNRWERSTLLPHGPNHGGRADLFYTNYTLGSTNDLFDIR